MARAILWAMATSGGQFKFPQLTLCMFTREDFLECVAKNKCEDDSRAVVRIRVLAGAGCDRVVVRFIVEAMDLSSRS